jgi:hypothetical protein
MWFSVAGRLQDKVRRPWLAALLLACVMWGAQASTDSIQVLETQVEYLEQTEPGWHVSATFKLELSQRLEDAVNRGLPLIFVTEIEVLRPRWYWFDEKNVIISQSHRLSYNALTQQYRVSSGALSQRFDTLTEAIAMISRVRHLRIGSRQDFKTGSQYEMAIRIRLDTTQLPKPFQVNAMTNKEWTLASEWRRYTFLATPEASR